MPSTPLPRILAFDVFGTLVDWHSSIVRYMALHYPQVDGPAFARAWRSGYQPAMAQVRSAKRAWVPLDTLHREILDGLLAPFGLGHLSAADRHALNQVWHTLDAWPDSAAALGVLKKHCTITPLSNGNLSLLTHLSKHNAFAWDCVLSAEVFHAYKPDPATYLGVARIFDCAPHAVMLVAAHQDDLAAARACGLQTAYVERPWEWGEQQPKDTAPQADNDVHCKNLMDLVQQLLA